MLLESLPLDIKIRILGSLPFDTLLLVIDNFPFFNKLFHLYPRLILASIGDTNNDISLPVLLALTSLNLRLKRSDLQDEVGIDSLEHNDEIEARYESVVPAFLEAWHIQSLSSLSSQIKFWADAILRPEAPYTALIHNGSEEDLKPLSTSTLSILKEIHNTTSLYAEEYISRKLKKLLLDARGNATRFVKRPPLPDPATFMVPSPAEKHRIHQSFYNLWILCHVLSYLRQGENGKKYMDGFFVALETIWDAYAIQAVYFFLKEKGMGAAIPYSRYEWNKHVRVREGAASWFMNDPMYVRRLLASTLLLHSHSPSLYTFLHTRPPPQTHPLLILATESIHQLPITQDHPPIVTPLDTALHTGSHRTPFFSNILFRLDRTDPSTWTPQSSYTEYVPHKWGTSVQKRRVYKKGGCKAERNYDQMAIGGRDEDGGASVWDEERLGTVGYLWPGEEEGLRVEVDDGRWI